MIKKIVYYRGKPYFLYKISEKKPDIAYLKRTIPRIEVYWQPVFNMRTKRDGYAIYLTKVTSYY